MTVERGAPATGGDAGPPRRDGGIARFRAHFFHRVVREYMEYEEVVETRRTVREYADEGVDEETLRAIFEDARWAPSGYNLQPWEFLVCRDEETKARLREVANDQPQVTDASAAVVVFGNADPAAHAERVFTDMLEKGYLPDAEARDAMVERVEGLRDRTEEENRLWATRSTALAAMALMHAAWDRGVASCPMEGFDADALVAEFDVPDEYEPVMLVTLGYPADDAEATNRPRKFRRPVDEIVHVDEFSPDAHAEAPAPGDD